MSTKVQFEGFPGAPKNIKKHHVAFAVNTIVTKYRESKDIPLDVQLTEDEVDLILDGVRKLMLELEEIKNTNRLK